MTAPRDDLDRATAAHPPAPPQDAPAATGAYMPSDEPDPRATDAYRPTPPRSDRYVVRKFHARGGMGEVWLADDAEIGRPVALKRLRADGASQGDRFLTEARITGQLEHPGVVPVHDLGRDDEGKPFYVMAFVQGRTLQTVIAEYHNGDATTTPREVQWLRLLESFVQLCQTVAYAHSRGVIHRDIKPDNVMLGPYGETLVLDWGLAKILGEPDTAAGASHVPLSSGTGSSSETEGGQVLGAPLYMAPEVAEGRAAEADQRTDVYLLGATLYEILTGRPPREGKSKAQLIELARTTPPPPPRRLSPQVPRALEAICLKAMSRRKEDRYGDAQAVASDVQRFLAGEPVSAFPEGPLARAARWAWRRRRLLTRTALLVGLLFGGFLVFQRLQQAEVERSEARRVALVLQRQDEARAAVADFRKLADEAQFFAASTDPVAERAPYFVPQKGEEAARAAETIARGWGPGLEELPLSEELPALRKEVYELLLLLAQLRSPNAAPESLSLLERAAGLEKPSRGWYRIQAACLRRLDRVPDAVVAELKATDSETPGAALDHFLNGEFLRRQTAAGNFKDAQEEYRRAIQIDPTHYWARFQLGRCYLAQGQDEQAVEALSVCVRLRPKAPWAYSVRGLARGMAQQFAEAEADLKRALELSPDFRPARLNLGAVYWINKDPERALNEFDAVLQPPTARRLIEAAYYRGLLRLDRQEPAKAVEDFTALLREQPGFRPAFLARAQAHFAQNRDEPGMQDLNAYLLAGDPNFDPTSPMAAEQRGRLLRRHLPTWKLTRAGRKAKLELALAELDRALQGGQRSSPLFDDRGAVLELLGRILEALRAYDQGLLLDAENVKLLLKRGWAHGNSIPPQYEKAEADFARVLRLAPGNAEAHAGLAFMRACREAPADAQRAAVGALLHGSGDYLILHNVACVYARLAESDRERQTACEDLALDLLRRAVELWCRRKTGPNELALIRQEPAFQGGLAKRPEFEQLLRDDCAKLSPLR